MVAADRRADAVLELEDDALGALLADARHPGERLDVLGGDRAAYVVGAHHRDDRLGDLGADAGGGLHDLEDLLLVLVEEAEDRQAVLAHDHAGGQRRGPADAQGGERAGGAHQLEADAAHLEHGAVERDGGDLAADEGDHRVLTVVFLWCGAGLRGRGLEPGAAPSRATRG